MIHGKKLVMVIPSLQFGIGALNKSIQFFFQQLGLSHIASLELPSLEAL
jgi:hypothetical protein